MTSSAAIIQAMETWVAEFVVARDVCPFAKVPWQKSSIRYVIAESPGDESALQQLMEEVWFLDNNESTDTTLFVLPEHKVFDDYLELLALSNELLSAQGYDGVYQLASFHPDYCFEGCEESDLENYTNRSPFPALHLLRESQIEEGLSHYQGNPEAIYQQNMALMKALGEEKLQQFLKEIQPTSGTTDDT